MINIYGKVRELAREGRPAVMGTIIRQAGPAPRGLGAKFLVMEDGSIFGTIGGGSLEGQAMAEAPKVLAGGRPETLEFDLTGVDVAETDMLCGGEVAVFLEPVFPRDDAHAALAGRVVKALQRGGSGGLLVTVLNPERWAADQAPKFFMAGDGTRTGYGAEDRALGAALGPRLGAILAKPQPVLLSAADDSGALLDLFVEPVVGRTVLYVFGGGHVSQQIVPFAARVDFPVVVIDDREEFANPRLFPDAQETLAMEFPGLMQKLPIDEAAYLVIVTRGHMHDKTVLEQALRTNARYIGMIGSRRKRDIIYRKLLEEGFTEEDLARVHAPIGLDIGAETPAEIAVSIVAELIVARAGGPSKTGGGIAVERGVKGGRTS